MPHSPLKRIISSVITVLVKFNRFFAIQLILWIISSGSYLYSQPDVFQKTGLLSDLLDVYSVFQDRSGYYWLGTDPSLYRYDGERMEDLYPEEGGVEPILTIMQDSYNDIWFGTSRGTLARVKGKEFQIAHFDSISIKGEIIKIVQTDFKSLWVVTSEEGAILIELPLPDINRIKARRFDRKDNLSEFITGACLYPETGTLLCSTISGIQLFEQNSSKFENWLNLPLDYYTCLALDKYWTILVGTKEGIVTVFEATIDTIDLLSHGCRSNRTVCITTDSKNRIWAATDEDEIVMIEDRSVKVFDYQDAVFDIIEDKEGNILIAGRSGLRIFGESTLDVFPGNKLLHSVSVNTFAEDSFGAIWIGTPSGLYRFWPESDQKPEIFNREEVKLLDLDQNNDIWIGGARGISKLDRKLSRFIPQADINSIITEGSQLLAMEFDKNNNLFIGTNDGIIAKIDDEVLSGQALSQVCVLGSVSVLHCDANNKLWIGSEAKIKQPGLFKFDCDSFRCNQVGGTSGMTVTSLASDSAGTLWIGTNTSGLYYCKNDYAFKLENQPEGLISGQITSLGISPRNEILIGTNSGLWIYSIDTRKFIYFSKYDGLIDGYINSKGILFDRNGQGWIATKSGVNILPKEYNFISSKAPIPIIKSVELNSVATNPDSISSISYSNNQISFNVGFSSFTNPASVIIKARLSGLDKDWVDYGQTTRIKYPPLPGGRYVFSVMTETDKGGISEIVNFSFRIRPPWWKSIYAYLFYLAVLVFLIVIYVKRRESRLKQKNEMLELAVKNRTAEIETQKEEIKEQRDRITAQRDLLKDQRDLIASQNKDLTDSIHYALRIQSSLVPSPGYLSNILNDYFIFYKPRDIVSGDFYWLDIQGSNLIVVGADCTGHGVPGALISMLGITFLDEIVKTNKIIEPDKILNWLRAKVIDSFKQEGSEEGLKDGMDIAVVSINLETLILDYSGAKNPLYLIKNGKLIEFKADKYPVSYYSVLPPYTNHRINLERGDAIYIFSDGYADQFGGPGNKKFRYSQFRNLLLELNGMKMSDQKDVLSSTFESWKGNHDQVDDVLVIGIRF